MKIFLVIVILFFTFSFTQKIPCEKIKDGYYFSVPDNSTGNNYNKYELRITDSIAIITQNYLPYEYKIELISDCNFHFSDFHVHDTSQLTKLQKQLLRLGQPYFDIDKKNDDTLYFIHRVNLHIQISSGKFIRKK